MEGLMSVTMQGVASPPPAWRLRENGQQQAGASGSPCSTRRVGHWKQCRMGLPQPWLGRPLIAFYSLPARQPASQTRNVSRGEPRPVPTGLAVYKNAAVVATFSEQGDVRNGAIAVRGNVIAWVGPSDELPEEFAAAEVRGMLRWWQP